MGTENFIGGLPTNLDVKKMRDSFPENTLPHGTIIPYREVEDILGVKKGSNRFNGVTYRWRQIILKETNIIIGTERGVGFKLLNDSEKVDLSGGKLRTAASAMRKSQIFASKVNIKNITQEEKARLDLYGLRGSKAYAMLQIKSVLSLPSMETERKQ